MKTERISTPTAPVRAADHGETGASATEYTIIIALISLAIVAVISMFGQSSFDLFQTSTGQLETKVKSHGFGAGPGQRDGAEAENKKPAKKKDHASSASGPDESRSGVGYIVVAAFTLSLFGVAFFAARRKKGRR